MWRLKGLLGGESQVSRPMGVRAGGKGSRSRLQEGRQGAGRGGGGGQAGVSLLGKGQSKHLKGSPGQRQTLSHQCSHNLAPTSLPAAIRALTSSRVSRLWKCHGQVTPAAVAAAAAHALWPRGW